MLSLLVGVAFAKTWAPYDGGFISPPRDDVPTDGVVLYAANYEPEVVAVDTDGNVVVLTATLVTGVGAEPVVALHPPAGGWVAGTTWELSSPDDGYGATTGEIFALGFTVGTSPAPDALAPVVGDLQVGEWSEESTYPWGCCEPTRTVSVEVNVPDADLWAWVELVGQYDFAEPSQITSEEVHTHLDVALGAGDHTLKLTQWLDDRGTQPRCFDVVPMSAAGVAGPSQTLCPDEDADDTDTDHAGGGCATGGVPVSWAVLVLPWLRRRRRDL